VDLRALVDKDVALTEKALAQVKLAPPPRSHLRKVAEDFLGMARAYFEDARHFRERGELERALANVNYAHGWLDAGARVGLFDVGGDDQLFTLSERSEDARALVVDGATLQRPEFQGQGRELLGVPRRQQRISGHRHHRPAEHAPGPNHL